MFQNFDSIINIHKIWEFEIIGVLNSERSLLLCTIFATIISVAGLSRPCAWLPHSSSYIHHSLITSLNVSSAHSDYEAWSAWMFRDNIPDGPMLNNKRVILHSISHEIFSNGWYVESVGKANTYLRSF
jgi:hypothetical protein